VLYLLQRAGISVNSFKKPCDDPFNYCEVRSIAPSTVISLYLRSRVRCKRKNNENSKHENIVFYSGKICIGVQIGFSKIKDFYSAETQPLLRQQHLSVSASFAELGTKSLYRYFLVHDTVFESMSNGVTRNNWFCTSNASIIRFNPDETVTNGTI
jgi:hypothetical protein